MNKITGFEKRFLSLLLSIAMVFSIIPTVAFAEETIIDSSELVQAIVCICESKCSEENTNSACELCVEDLAVCEAEEVIVEPAICICESTCSEESINSGCAVCEDAFDKCEVEEITETTAYEKVVALFEALPKADSLTEETTDEEREYLVAKLNEAMAAYEELTEEEHAKFEEEHSDLLGNAIALNDSIHSEDDLEDNVLTTDKSSIMMFDYKYDRENKLDRFWIKGLFNKIEKDTTFQNEGFITYVKTLKDESIPMMDQVTAKVTAQAEPVPIEGTNLSVGIKSESLNDGQTIQILYTVKNTGTTDVTYSMGSGADIKIGEDDYALITPFSDGGGFKLVSASDADKDDKGEYAQLNFWGKNTKGVTDVDDFWYGAYSDDDVIAIEEGQFWWNNNERAVFFGENEWGTEDKVKVYPYDSAMSWSWKDKTISAGETQTYTVLFGIGGPGSEGVATGLFSTLDSTRTITLDQNSISSFQPTDFEVKLGTRTLTEGIHYTLSDLNSNKPSITFLDTVSITTGSVFTVLVNGVNGEEPIPIRIDLTAFPPKPISPTLSFDARNGNNPADEEINDSMPSLSIPTWGDYTFGGWYTDIDGRGTEVTLEYAKGLDVDTMVYAKWTKNEKIVRTEVLDLSAKKADQRDDEQGWSFKYNDKGSVLTLDNTTIYTDDVSALKLPEDTTIILSEGTINTTITSDDKDYGNIKSGIRANGKLTISGNGILNVTGGSNLGKANAGIYSEGDIIIEGGTINVNTSSGTANNENSESYAIQGINVTIAGGTVSAKATAESAVGIVGINVTIAGGTVSTKATGIEAYGILSQEVYIKGGTTTAEGRVGGIVAEKMLIEGDATIMEGDESPGVQVTEYTGKNYVQISYGRPVTVTGVRVGGLIDNRKDYDGTAVSATGTPVAKDGEKDVEVASYEYIWKKKNTDNTYTDLTTAPIDAGDYQLVVSVNDTSYIGKQEIPFTITQKPIAIEADNVVIYQGEALPIYTYTTTGLVGADTLESIGLTVAVTCAAISSDTDGSYDITINVSGTATNYSYTTANGTLTVAITKKIEVPTTDPATPIIDPIVVAEPTDGKDLRLVVGELHEADLAKAQIELPTPTNGKVEFAEIELQVSTDGGTSWHKATEDDIKNGLAKVFMPLPAGTSTSTHTFKVHHFEKGSDNAPVELDTIVTEVGASATVKSFSPFAIVATKKASGGGGNTSDGGSTSGGNTSDGSSYKDYTITTIAGDGGAISTDKPGSIREGGSIDFTITPNKGYVIADVKVDGKSIGAVANYTFTNVRANHTIEATFKASNTPITPQPVVDFEDVNPNDWFYDAVYKVVEKGWFTGTSETTFEPNIGTTRGMIITVLWRMENEPKPNKVISFTDVAEDSYCYDAVAWGAEHTIVKGYDAENYKPNQIISRQELAAILYRYAQYKNYDVSVGEENNILSYTDATSVGEWAMPAMQWACASELLGGSDGKLMPLNHATRAQFATVLIRLNELLNEK